MRIGIIGASFARAAYLPALRHVEGAEVVAIASGRLESATEAARAFAIPRATDDWRAMLAEERLDLALIATPADLHAPMTLEALARGAHVLCEKPTALDAGEAEAMLAAQRAAGRLGMIDHELRFNPNRRHLARLIREGELGEIRHVNISNIGSSWADPASRPKNDWWSLKSHGGGRLGANGSHQVDLLRWWLGPVRSVVGQALTVVPDRIDKRTGEPWRADADDLAHLTLEMTNGALAQVFMSGVAASNMGNRTEVFGSRGTATLDNETERLLVSRGGGPFQDETQDDPDAALPGLNRGIWNVSVVAALRELTSAIRDGRPMREGATFADGVANQRVLDAVQRSTIERRWIDLAEEPR